MVFIGTTQGKLLALKSHDGTKLWSFQTQGGIYSSPAVLENPKKGRIFVGSSDGTLRALTFKGTQKWKFQTSDAILSSPTVGQVKSLWKDDKGNKKDKYDPSDTKGPENQGKDVVIVGSNDGKLYLLPAYPDDNNPEPIWVSDLHSTILGKPALDEDNDEIFVGTQNCTFYLISAKDGKILDKMKVDGPLRSSPAIKDVLPGKSDKAPESLVFFGAGHKFYMVESDHGHLNSKYTKDIGKLIVSSVALVGGWDMGGQVTQEEKGDDNHGDSDDKDNWKDGQNDSDEKNHGHDEGDGPQNLVVIGSDDGKAYVFQVDIKNLSASLAATFDTLGKIYSSPAGGGGFFAVGSGNHKIQTVSLADLFTAKNPAAAWEYTTGSSVESSPALSGESLYVASDDGNLYAFKSTQPGKATHFDLSAPAQVEAVTEFPMGITARDANGNLAFGYRGTAQVSGLDPSGQDQGMGSVVFNKTNLGSSSIELSLITMGDWTLTASDPVLGITGSTQLAVTTLAGFLSPSNGELVNHIVEITGDQSDTEHIEWAPSGTEAWTPLARDTSLPRLAAKWDTGRLAPGPYDLRLVRTQDGLELGRMTVTVGVPDYERTLDLPTPNQLTDVDLGGNRLFAVDQQHNNVDVFNGSDSPNGTLGSYGTRTGEIDNPNKAAAGADGTLYVADTGNGRVEVFPAWSNLLPFDIGKGVLHSPQAVEVRGSFLYVLDGTTIDRFTLGGQLVATSTAKGLGPYSDLAVDDQGRVYLANLGQQDLEIYTPNGSFDYAFDGKGKQSSGGTEASWVPSSVSFADDGPLANNGGRLYVTDRANHRVQKFGLDGNHLMTFGGFGVAHGQFDQPSASAVNSQSSIYVADAGNQRLEKFNQPAIHLVPTPTPGAVLTVNLSANPDVFDPAAFSTTLAYTMDYAANVSIVITNASGSMVFQQSYVAGGYGGRQGLNQVAWNGQLAGNPLPDGPYTVTLTALANGQQAIQRVLVTIQTGAIAPTWTPTPLFNPATSTPTFTPTPNAQSTPICPPVRLHVRPVLECVQNLGNGQYAAHFGYDNDSQDACGKHADVVIPLGSNNYITPAQYDGAEPANFIGDEVSGVLTVVFKAGETVSWTVDGMIVQANDRSPSCGNSVPTSTPVPPLPTPTFTPTATRTYTPAPSSFSITGFSLNPGTIDRGHSTTVQFTLPGPATMTIQVIDKNGKQVYSTSFNGNPGANSYVYDGSRNMGSGRGGTLPPGTYTFILSGMGASGSDSEQTTLRVTP